MTQFKHKMEIDIVALEEQRKELKKKMQEAKETREKLNKISSF